MKTCTREKGRHTPVITAEGKTSYESSRRVKAVKMHAFCSVLLFYLLRHAVYMHVQLGSKDKEKLPSYKLHGRHRLDEPEVSHPPTLPVIYVYHFWFGSFYLFPWDVLPLQSDWSLSCDHGLDIVRANVRTTTNNMCTLYGTWYIATTRAPLRGRPTPPATLAQERIQKKSKGAEQ